MVNKPIALDSQDNIYLTGWQTNDYGEGNTNIFLVKFNNSGDLQWNRTWDESYRTYVKNIAFDSEGNIYLAGFKTDDTIDLGDLSYNYDVFLVKYNSEGYQLWNVTWDGRYNDYCFGITIDSQRNIFLVGGSSSLVGHRDLLLLKYNNIGELQWNNTWGGVRSYNGYDIALDSAENIYITGATGGSKMFLMKIPNSYVTLILGYEPFILLAIAFVIIIILFKKSSHHLRKSIASENN